MFPKDVNFTRFAEIMESCLQLANARKVNHKGCTVVDDQWKIQVALNLAWA